MAGRFSIPTQPPSGNRVNKVLPDMSWLRSTAKVASLYRRTVAFLNGYGYPLWSLVRRDFKIRYAPTSLGLVWAVLQPAILIVLYTLVFSTILRSKFRPGGGPGDFVMYLLCGFLPYMSLAEGVQRGSTSLVDNRSLLHKALFPAEILPAVAVLSAAVTEIIGLVAILGLEIFFGVRLSVWLVFLPLIVLLRIVITLGLAWLVSVLNAFFRDMGQFLGLMLTAWMFLTPIFYPTKAIPDGLLWLLQINPLYLVIAAYRAVMLEANSPLSVLGGLIVWAAVTPILGLWFFRQTIDRVKDFL